MATRFGNYDDDAVWTRGTYEMRPRSPGPIPPASPNNGVYYNAPGNIPHTTMVHSSMKPVPDSDIYKVGIYGWRKRCLYGFIVLLTIVIVVNLALTLWIMTVLNFTSDGMGAMKIDDEGIRVEGKTEFDRPVKFSELSTPEDEALFIDSASGVYINARNLSGQTTAGLSLNPDGKSSVVCQRFEVLNMDHKLLFFVDSEEIGLKLENLRILDDGGSVFEGAVQTSSIQPEPDTPLKLESPTRNLEIDAGQDIELLSGAGEIQLNSLLDINLNSKHGEVRIDAGNIFMSGLERSNGVGQAQLQLCVCQDGKLFLAAQRADCRADRSICE
ncbi:unnamed protein product [Bursaphelenchus xylophilus]|uniref:(pine wood nematode) hypothetical protein n=1 Tax=Bursaphelenchus xylophilus TaxID=6326 RepID=A0A1I7SW78_BURXY|nr:unnamed protein product [Bursaphelenchus xylophilus]CAG9098957.1 unnamed protein product [Bursaphelenchus xylophilus]